MRSEMHVAADGGIDPINELGARGDRFWAPDGIAGAPAGANGNTSEQGRRNRHGSVGAPSFLSPSQRKPVPPLAGSRAQHPPRSGACD